MATDVTVGILTVSDSCFRKEKEDVSGKQLRETIKTSFPNYKITFQDIAPDEKEAITSTLQAWISKRCNIIFSTGGTGFSPRDITPEATRQIIEREAPGLAYAMICKSLAVTPMAMLSRSVCGIKEQSIIINLPGSPKGAVECFSFVKPALPHAIAVLLNKTETVIADHKLIQSRVSADNIADRPRESAFSMLEVEEALNLIIENSPIIENNVEQIKIEDALYRVLAENITSFHNLPPFDASIKDGYAVITSDGDGPRNVRNHVAAGDFPNQKLSKGEAFRICTGAPIPDGADAVVQVEDTHVLKSENGEEIEIHINKPPSLGQDIRRAGTDIKKNDLVFVKSRRLKAAEIGVLAALGKSTILVYKKPTVGIFSTGNELKNHEEKLESGQIHDSNRLNLINLYKQHHFPCNDCGIVKDEPNCLKAAFVAALKTNDILVTTGGVSMGEFDFVKRVLVEDFEANIHFGRVNMKPGKPTTFATLTFQGTKKIVFGLPGNPVSAGVTSLLFVIPLLRYLERAAVWTFPTLPYSVTSTKTNLDPRPEYVRVVVTFENGEIRAISNGNQISSRLNSLTGANGLLLMPGNMLPGVEYCSKLLLIDQIICS